MFQFEIDDPVETSKDGNETINPQDISTEFHLGDKIICEKYLGEIKFIGAVSPHSGNWLGIEWDDSSRGKHSGSVDGIEYFKSSKPNSASFIRLHKAKKIKSLIQALNERYGYDPAVMSTLKDIDNRLEKKKIEFSTLTTLDLCSRQVYDLGDPEEIVALCPSVTFLDIADNLITSWVPIVQLCRKFTKLQRLDVSDNELSNPSDEDLKSSIGSFPALRHIILGKISNDWSQIISASCLWPYVTNLQAPYNDISTLSPPSISLLNITSLDLGGNKIKDWDEVIKLSILERLEYLNLCGNKLISIHFTSIGDSDGEKTPPKTNLFSSLQRLNLSENSIQSWSSVSELNKLKSLTELRIERNPFLSADSRVNIRQWIIARIGKLKKVEGGEINRQERRDAEVDYLKKFAANWTQEGADIKFCIEHSRYGELVEKFGKSDVEETDSTTKSMRCNLITINLKPDNSNLKSCEKKIIHSMSVQKLKALLQRTFKTARPPTELQLVSLRNPNVSFILENDFFDLSQYSVEEGDTLIVRW